MRTNIELDDKLVGRAMKAVGAHTKREVVHRALLELVSSRERRKVLEMFGSGSIAPDYDHKAARAGRAR
jgi:Arc/MetJ family transcription regulator